MPFVIRPCRGLSLDTATLFEKQKIFHFEGIAPHLTIMLTLLPLPYCPDEQKSYFAAGLYA